MTSVAGNSRFLAYLEQRRSLTASQSSGIAKHLRDYDTRRADMEAELSRTQPGMSTRAAAPSSAPSATTASHYTTACAPSPLDAGDEEHKETILSSASTLSAASSNSDMSPLASPPTPAASSTSSYLAPASSLLHREVVDLRLRLQRAEDEHMAERKRWEQQRAAERREAEEWKRKAEEKREREEESDDERTKLRRERDEWQSERLVMQQELDRLNVYFQQLSASPTNTASSSSLSSALSIVAGAKDREENNRLRRKNNRLIDAVTHKQAECDALSAQVAQLTQGKQQQQQQTAEHSTERTRLQQQVEQLTSEVARLRKAEVEWQQKQSDKKEVERARLQYVEKEAKYKLREADYKQSIERLTQLAADRKNVNSELEWMKDAQLQLTTQCAQLKERAEEAERRAEELRAQCQQWKDNCNNTERVLAAAMTKQGESREAQRMDTADSEWSKRAGEKLQMEERLAKLEHERGVLEQLLRKEREARVGASSSVGGVRVAAMQALDAIVPVASPVSSKAATLSFASSSPTNATAVSSESHISNHPLPSPAKRTTLQQTVSLPASVGVSPSSSTSTSTSTFFRQGRRASLPAPQQLTHSNTQPLPTSVVHRSALKAPLKAVHPNPVQPTTTDLPPAGVVASSSSSSSPRSASPSSSNSSLTSSGGSVHRVRFASPLTVTADEAGSSCAGLGVLTARDDNLKERREQPDTPTRSRLKELVLGFF